MLKIGLTGGIGSGKTYVSDVFKIFNIPVYYCDIRAKYILNTNPEVKRKLIAELGGDVYTPYQLNKKVLSKIIFNDKKLLEKTNTLIKEYVWNDFELWTKKAKKVPYLLCESALLFESQIAGNFDKIITVTAPQELRIDRVIKRENKKKESVELVMRNQLPESEKTSKANYIICNDEKSLLLPQIIKIHKEIIAVHR